MRSAFRLILVITILGFQSGCAATHTNSTVSQQYTTQFGANWHEFWDSPIGKLLLFATTGRYPI
jgi:hypothetical protein